MTLFNLENLINTPTYFQSDKSCFMDLVLVLARSVISKIQKRPMLEHLITIT